MNIRVDLNTPIYDGAEVVFRSPVDCSQVTGLIVYYPENGNSASKEFAFADAHGNNVGDIDHLFAENVAVKVILDVTTSMAFVQNADTNAYLEGRFSAIEETLDGVFHNGDNTINLGEVTAEYKGLTTDGENDEVVADIELSHPDGLAGVRLRGLAESTEPTGAVNNQRLSTEMSRVEADIQSGDDSVIDRICPSFEKSSAVVTCEPVVGHPLKVVSNLAESEKGYTTMTMYRCGKNLVNPQKYILDASQTTLDGDVFTTTTNSGTVFVNNNWGGRAAFCRPGTYTASIIPVSENVKLSMIIYNRAGKEIFTHSAQPSRGYRLTFTAQEDFRFGIGGGDYTMWGTHSYKLQLEVGATATAFEPYKGDYFTANFGRTVMGGSFDWGTGILTDENGETTQLKPQRIPGQSGLNTIYSSTGNTEVKGSSDPVAIIDKLTQAIISLGGNV